MTGHGADNLVLCVLEGVGDDAGAGLEVADLLLTRLEARELRRTEDTTLAVVGRRDLCGFETGNIARTVDKVETAAGRDGTGSCVAKATQDASRHTSRSQLWGEKKE